MNLNSSYYSEFQTIFWKSFIFIVLNTFSFSNNLIAQVSYPNQIRALKVNSVPKLDGILSEKAWQKQTKFQTLLKEN